MDKTRHTKVSKYLSKHLRHTPERLGLTLDVGGWVGVDELLSACAAQQFPITRAELEDVVANSDKQRFSLDATKTRIRANQGHSVAVDLQLEPQTPPDVLYHGTGEQSVPAILQSGLVKMSRHHVHLSRDVETARKVGMRHGRPAILAIDTAAMQRAGFTFYCSENGVWLVDEVPATYLEAVKTDS
ncbi:MULTISPECIES: RNA 2'-phosphotransferase [unclassified Leptolyngbya]|uniref:RNA 2'-phosphotransferase n=1 Tax=unclassified Leptolyngbya TaxID=2650499 RepID=UPI001685ADDD|nr:MULTISPECIES: RNA 2'-phosphotransferase [unclassified Leptolyngbya]MBD1913990.1 RNA 2'-phosphotransferase [Leptolyngbya sp. FACHB-8]MBD2154400.1 RNA 2'-phosphotransferase [Leptolyngbya sp. FACHB-16]